MRDRFFVCVYIPKAHHAIAGGLQKAGALGVVVPLLRQIVMGAIQLDDELGAMAGEVGIAGSDLRLVAEVESLTAQQPKAAPNSLFGFGGVFAQRSRPFNRHLCFAPHP
ncbi:MAG TPA: hypothetical protein VIM02_00760 [Rhizomicrobium sp.]